MSSQSYIQLSADQTELIIINQKPIRKVEYANTTDRTIVKQEMKKHQEKRNNYYYQRDNKFETVNNERKVTELDEELDDVRFKDVKSASSCKLSDI